MASLIWTGSLDAPVAETPLHVIAGGCAPPGLPFSARALAVLPLVGAGDDRRRNLSPAAAGQTGWRILNLLASVAIDSAGLEERIEETLARAWTSHPGGADAIRRALILSAFHTQDGSLAAARCVARAGADPWGVVIAGLVAAGESRPALRPLERRLSLPAGSGTAIDLIGRSIRWIGAAIRVYGG